MRPSWPSEHPCNHNDKTEEPPRRCSTGSRKNGQAWCTFALWPVSIAMSSQTDAAHNETHDDAGEVGGAGALGLLQT